MARIDVLPSIEIIRGLKGILDFYVWRGLPCVRAWPKYRPANQTAASLAAALTFGAIVKAYSLMGEIALQAYRDDAAGQPRSARDIYVSSQYGNLHEADMSDFLTLLTESRDFLSDLTALLEALHSVNTDELVVRTEHSVLPDGASTAAAQASQLTALQKLDDLQDALESNALDRLLVRGMNQLFSYKDVLLDQTQAVVSGANGYIHSNSPPEGDIWICTHIASRDITSPTTAHVHSLNRAAAWRIFHEQTKAFAAGQPSIVHGFTYLEHDDKIQAIYTGAQAGDTCRIDLVGFIMTKET